jgi:hypothetical protein
MFPSPLPSEESHFHAIPFPHHSSAWGGEDTPITPQPVYATYASQWEVFATTYPHQAFLLKQLKSIYDNLAVVLRVFQDKQRQRDPYNDGFVPRYNRYGDYGSRKGPRKAEKDDLNFSMLDPFEYFQDEKIDYGLREIFLDLSVCLMTDKRGSRCGTTWREIGRLILENAYDAERAKLVEELTSEATVEALSAVPGGSVGYAAIWKVRSQVVVRENATQQGLKRLRELLEEDQKEAKRAKERKARARSRNGQHGRGRRCDRFGETRHEQPGPVIFDNPTPFPVRERRRSRSRSDSSEDSTIEIIEDTGEED